jgi:hypothetical protein
LNPVVRSMQFTPIDEPHGLRESRKAKITFECEFPAYGMFNLRNVSLKLSLRLEIYDFIGRPLPAETMQEWRMTPIFNQFEEVVWTNLAEGSMRDMRSEDLLDYTLTFFADAIDSSIAYDRQV